MQLTWFDFVKTGVKESDNRSCYITTRYKDYKSDVFKLKGLSTMVDYVSYLGENFTN